MSAKYHWQYYIVLYHRKVDIGPLSILIDSGFIWEGRKMAQRSTCLLRLVFLKITFRIDQSFDKLSS